MKFVCGDSVQLAITGEDGEALLKSCEAVGITSVESVQQAVAFRVPLGTVLYTVEFGDGSEAFMPESALSPLT